MKTTISLLMAATLFVIAGCTTTKLIEDPPGSGNLKKVAVTDPRFTTGLDTATGVAGVFGPINPWHGLVTIALGTVAAVAEWNKRRKQAQLDTVIAGVEAKGGADVKSAIEKIATAKGIEPQLNKSVKAVTGG